MNAVSHEIVYRMKRKNQADSRKKNELVDDTVPTVFPQRIIPLLFYGSDSSLFRTDRSKKRSLFLSLQNQVRNPPGGQQRRITGGIFKFLLEGKQSKRNGSPGDHVLLNFFSTEMIQSTTQKTAGMTNTAYGEPSSNAKAPITAPNTKERMTR